MDAKVSWKKDLSFVGVADSGYPVQMDSRSGPTSGVGPVELTLMALAGCTAMDVMSILKKKQEQVKEFDILAHAERGTNHPRIITKADLEYVVAGNGIQEASLVRAIELSVNQYCSVHAMLEKAFSIKIKYSIYEIKSENQKDLVAQGQIQRHI